MCYSVNVQYVVLLLLLLSATITLTRLTDKMMEKVRKVLVPRLQKKRREI